MIYRLICIHQLRIYILMVAVHIYFFEIEKRRPTVNDEKTRYKKKTEKNGNEVSAGVSVNKQNKDMLRAQTQKRQ